MYKKVFRVVKKAHEFILTHYFAMGLIYLLTYAIFVYYYPITSQTIDNMYLIPLSISTGIYLIIECILYLLLNIAHIKFYCWLIKSLKNSDFGKLLNISFSLNYCANVYTLLLLMVHSALRTIFETYILNI